jgi:hypothetical protein
LLLWTFFVWIIDFLFLNYFIAWIKRIYFSFKNISLIKLCSLFVIYSPWKMIIITLSILTIGVLHFKLIILLFFIKLIDFSLYQKFVLIYHLKCFAFYLSIIIILMIIQELYLIILFLRIDIDLILFKIIFGLKKHSLIEPSNEICIIANILWWMIFAAFDFSWCSSFNK